MEKQVTLQKSLVALGMMFAVSISNVSFLETFDYSIIHNHQKELVGSKRAPQSLESQKSSEIISRIVLNEVRKNLPKKYKSQALVISQAIITESKKHQMDPLFVLSIIRQESRMNPVAIGSVGEIGLMQIRPSTAKWLNDKYQIVGKVDLKDPVINIKIGTFFLSTLRKSFNGESLHYISAYNMGAANVRKKIRSQVKPRIYAGHVMKHYVGYVQTLESSQMKLNKIAGLN